MNIDPALLDDSANGPYFSRSEDQNDLQSNVSPAGIVSNPQRQGDATAVDDGDDGEELVSEADSDFDMNDLVTAVQTDNQIRRNDSQRGSARGQRSRGRGDTGLKRGRGRPRKDGQRGSKKGVKKGFRKPLEPSEEFKQFHSSASTAFIEGNLELAEEYATKAIVENPEMFVAHTLLHEIHMAQGDKQRALVALFNGAHTRPRDTETWAKVADLILEVGTDRKAALLDAIYCYNRIIGADRNNIDARFKRAEMNLEAGKKKRAQHDYGDLLRSLPHNLTVLRHLAESCETQAEREQAIKCYDRTILHYQGLRPNGLDVDDEEDETIFSWSDANIYAELFLLTEQYKVGISRLKYISRWLMGRGNENFWETFQEDDRELDRDDEPRRTAVAEFLSQTAPTEAYGVGLPLELRIRLGIFRLNLRHVEEAMRHFEWLEPDISGADSLINDYADLFREVGDNLKDKEQYALALRFYEPLQDSEMDTADTKFWTNLAACYKNLQRWDEAESAYRAIIELEQNDEIDAHMEVAAMLNDAGLPTRAKPYLDLAAQRRGKRASRRKTYDPANTRAEDAADPDMPIDSIEPDEDDVETSTGLGLVTHTDKPPKQPKTKRATARSRGINHETLRPDFERMQYLKNTYEKGSDEALISWMTKASEVLERFRQVKLFFPYDKSSRFYGYGSKAKQKQWLENNRQRSPSGYANDVDEPESADTYAEIKFTEWLDCFLQYAIYLARAGESENAYKVIHVCVECTIWFHDPHSLYLIHVIWVMCAVSLRDHKTINEVMRFFLKEHQFVTDSYRLFATVNRLCARNNSWYNLGPTQKFLLRQVKAVDYSLVPPPQRSRSIYEERAALSSRDKNGQLIPAKEMDVALLVLYGHCLYAGQSYAYSLNYFYRALALDPDNPMTVLTLALGYVHYALKRQSENRQVLIIQGLSFLQQYYKIRSKSPHAIERQEAEFNVAKTYHMLALTHIAVPGYEKVLVMSAEVKAETEEGTFTENFAVEAAYALQGIWVLSGQESKAMEVTQKWLVL